MPAICPGRSTVEWPLDWREMAETLWMEGASAGYIAGRLNAEFKAGLTRNAVIGKVQRLGLKRSEANVRKARAEWGRKSGATHGGWGGKVRLPKDAKPAAPDRPQPPIPTVHLSTITGCIITGPDPIAPEPVPVSLPQSGAAPITIDALTSRTCCWPIDPTSDHPQWRYCGDVRDPKSGRDHDRGYCTAHWRRSVSSVTVGRKRASLEAMVAGAE